MEVRYCMPAHGGGMFAAYRLFYRGRDSVARRSGRVAAAIHS